MAKYSLDALEPKVDPLDLGLLTYILKNASPLYGRTKIQKTVFLSEVRLKEHELVGPHFRFFRYNNGPFSRELLDACDVLSARGFMYRQLLSVTPRGDLLASFINELKKEPKNHDFFRILDRVLNECRPQSGERLMETVYSLEIQPEGKSYTAKIRDIPIGVDLIVPRGRDSLYIPDDIGWMIQEELKLTDKEIQQVRNDWPDWGRAPVRRLRNAIADEQS